MEVWNDARIEPAPTEVQAVMEIVRWYADALQKPVAVGQGKAPGGLRGDARLGTHAVRPLCALDRALSL